jgi:hypothetical protein
LADGAFAAYRPLDAFETLAIVTPGEVESFIRENLTPERLALSVVSPLER